MHLRLKNFSIGQFNRDVNRSHDPDEKYPRWAAYRQQIGSLIVGDRHRSIILGAGSLNDVDLSRLCNLSVSVVLADIDTDSIRLGIERQGLSTEQRLKLEIVRHDFSGAQNSRLFDKLEAAVQRQRPADSIIAILTETLAAMKPDTLLPGQSFDFVMSCPVYTQLVYTQIEVLLKILHTTGLYTYDELNRILIAAHQGMQAVLRHYNDLVLSLLEPGGQIILLADVLELQSDDPQLSVLKTQFEQNAIDSLIILSLIEEQGLELAVNGLADLADRLKTPAKNYFLWPFDQTKSYVVCSLTGN